MKNDYEILRISPLFCGFHPEELEPALQSLGAKRRTYDSGECILLAGQPAGQAGILLDGRAQVIREDYSGTRMILAELIPGELFGEAFACAFHEEKILPVTVLSVTGSAVLFIDCDRIIKVPGGRFQTRLIKNLLAVMAGKNLMLNRRLAHLSKRTTREKLLSYLSDQSNGKADFTIPFSRQELADYLCVERSAMCSVLTKLQKEGVLTVRKNRFRFLSAEENSVMHERPFQ